MPKITIHQIVTIRQCRDALTLARLRQKTLFRKKLGLELQMERSQVALAALDRKLHQKKAELDILTNQVTNIGNEWLEFNRRKLELEITVLEIRRRKLTPHSLIEKEKKLQSVTATLQELAQAIQELESHLDQLITSVDTNQSVKHSPPVLKGKVLPDLQVYHPIRQTPKRKTRK